MGIRNFRNYGILERLIALGYLRLIKDTTVSVATTSVTIDTDEDSQAFSFGKDSTLLLVSDIVGAVSSQIEIFVNNNLTVANYYSQILEVNSTTVSAVRVNRPRVGWLDLGNNFIVTDIKLTNDGYVTLQNSENRNYGGSSIRFEDGAFSSTFTTTALTRFDITSFSANAIGIGSRFQLYEVIN